MDKWGFSSPALVPIDNEFWLTYPVKKKTSRAFSNNAADEMTASGLQLY